MSDTVYVARNSLHSNEIMNYNTFTPRNLTGVGWGPCAAHADGIHTQKTKKIFEN